MPRKKNSRKALGKTCSNRLEEASSNIPPKGEYYATPSVVGVDKDKSQASQENIPPEAGTIKNHRYPTRGINLSPRESGSSAEKQSHRRGHKSSSTKTLKVRTAGSADKRPATSSDSRCPFFDQSSSLADISVELVLSFLPISCWGWLTITSKEFCSRLRSREILRHLSHSANLQFEPMNTLIPRLLAVERVASPSFIPAKPMGPLIETPVGGGIWCLELHQLTNLLFAGCWGPSHQIDLIKCWDASTGAPMGSLYGHFSDVKCLKECGPLLYSGSYDGTVRCWNVAHMEPQGEPFESSKPVLALIATPERLYTAYESGSVKCWDTATRRVLWSTSHPGPVTAIALNGPSHIVSAFTCQCFNGTGFSFKKLNVKDGSPVRGLLDEDWTPRKSISFLHSVSLDKVLMGFAAPLGTVASGAVVSEHKVAQVVSIAANPETRHLYGAAPLLRKKNTQSYSQYSKSISIEAPGWGMECHATHSNNLVMGTDNGKVIVCGLSGTTRRRVLDACAVAGNRSSSAKVTALCLAGTKIFVALQTAAGDRDTEGHSGQLLCFDLVPEPIESTWM